MAIWRGIGGSGESTNDSTVPIVTELLVDAEAARDAAQLAETNAETAASNAASSASTASTQASNAATSATNAASSASSASTSATNAASSASTAFTQASNAASSASAASTSATNAASSASSAASSASTATTKASEAATSATNAASSATAAASSASSAATQASNAASSASAASTSASNAATSESNAASSASAAAASYDSFDDRYLGAKSSAPTLDNDGNALLTGALYFNTSTNEMKVWSGSAWLNAYASLSGALLATNNLSDLNNVATARTNLGLGTAATQNSTAFATAAQGANADTAYGWGNHALAGYAADSAVVKLTGDQTIAGTKTFSSNPILSAGTANGVVYLNGSKVATSGSALTFDGTTFATQAVSATGITNNVNLLSLKDSGTSYTNGNNFAYLTNSTNAVVGALYHPEITSLGISGNSALVFGIGSTPAEQMRLTSTGLGIGTSSPSYKLHVNGYVYSGSGFVLLSQASGGGNIFEASGNTGIDFGTTSNTLSFTTSGSTRMRLDSSGNLGLGVTPSAWGLGSGKAVELSAGSLFTYTTQEIDLAFNSYFNGSNWIYKNTAAASYYRQISGQHQWYNAPSGTAGNTISFTQAMTLDASGNLQIGTTSGAFRLNISGSSGTGGLQVIDSTGLTGKLQARNGTSLIEIGAISNHGVAFVTNDTERARIDSSGRVCIGGTTVTDGHLLNIQGSTASNNIGIVLNKTNATAQIWGITNTGPLAFYNYTASSEAMRIDTSGNLGIGTTSPVFSAGSGVHLQRAGVATYRTYNSSSTAAGEFRADATGTAIDCRGLEVFRVLTGGSERARIDSSGNLLVGATSSAANSGTGVKLLPSGYVYVVAPSTTSDTYNYYNSTAGAYRFYVTNAGVINATSTTITAISDQRLKENIQDIDVGLDAVMALKPRKFDWKAGKGKDIKGDRGWIAQEFEQVFPDMITTWKDEPPEGEEPYKAVNADLIPVLVKAIQELKAEVDSLKAQLNKGA